MNITHGLPACPLPGFPVLTIGNFDGQHLGHQALVRAVVSSARKIKGVPTVLTFTPHPVEVLRPGASHNYLSDSVDKQAFFERLGITELIILPFTTELASLLPGQFVEQVLWHGLGTRKVFVGENFVFGKGRSGTIQDLRILGQEAQFSVEPISPVLIGQEIVSSTRIRKCVMAGKVAEAAQCLGRPYRLGGQVIPGDRRGAQIGWPTANIRLPVHRVLPADGIYATLAYIEGMPHCSVSYIGKRSTFLEGERLLEVHIFDRDLHLYGQELVVDFVEYIRDDRTFSSVEALLKQMAQDGERARAILAAYEAFCPSILESSSPNA